MGSYSQGSFRASGPRGDPLQSAIIDEIYEIAIYYPDDPSMYKDARPEDKKKMDQALAAVCPAFLRTPLYKSGLTNNNAYKLCCETVDYCSFLKSSWFLLICIGGGLFLVNIITIGLLICYFKCGKKGKNGGGGGGGSTPKKGGKSTGKMSKNRSKSSKTK